jgi:hypothetical protein
MIIPLLRHSSIRRLCLVLAGAVVLFAPGPAGAEELWLASHAASSQTSAGNNSSYPPFVISAQGRHVAFTSTASDLIAGGSDTNSTSDAFLWDRDTGVVTLISHAAAALTTAANGLSIPKAISADGRYVAFGSAATNLIAGGSDGNALEDTFLWDRDTGAVTLVSRAAGVATTSGNNSSFPTAISANGRYVAFGSRATNLITGVSDNNAETDAFLWDRDSGSVTLASRAAGAPATTANDTSYATAMSADGRYLAIVSRATDLIAGGSDTNGENDTFLWDRETGALTLVSRAAGTTGTAADGGESSPVAISADGRYLTFYSDAVNLIASAPDGNGAFDAFFWDRITETVTLISHAAGTTTTTGNGASMASAISADGRYVAVDSEATDLIVGGTDGNGVADAFLWDRDTGVLTLISHVPGVAMTAGNGESQANAISALGRYFAFSSTSSNLIAGGSDANSLMDVFVWDRATGESRLVSHVADSVTASGDNQSSTGRMSADGATVAFLSNASDLMPGSFNSFSQTFVASRYRVFSDDFESRNTLSWDIEAPPLPAPDVLRWTDLDLRDPHVFVQTTFCNDHTPHGAPGFSVNDELAQSLVTDADTDGFLDRTHLTVFRPLDPDAIAGRLDEGAARCTAPVGTTYCDWTDHDLSTPVTVAYDTLTAAGDCLEPQPGTTHPGYTPTIDPPSAPCFSATLGNVTMRLLGVSVPLHDVQVGGELVGVPPGSLANGLWMGFLDETDADAALLPTDLPLVGGQPLSSVFPGGTGNCAAHSDRDFWNGEWGWWIYFHFVASPVTFVGR